MSNPVLSDKAFSRADSSAENYMTVQGSVIKTGIFLLVLIISATFSYSYLSNNALVLNNSKTLTIMLVSAVFALILGLIITFKPKTASTLGFIYTIIEGCLIGIISFIYEAEFQGIVFEAVACTVLVLFTALLLYYKRIVKVTEKFRSIVIIAGSSLALLYIIVFVLNIFNIETPWFYDSSPLSIGISTVAVIIASVYLFLDFDFIEMGSEHRLDKYMEWYAAFGLMVTIIWLYLEILKLLAKLKRK